MATTYARLVQDARERLLEDAFPGHVTFRTFPHRADVHAYAGLIDLDVCFPADKYGAPQVCIGGNRPGQPREFAHHQIVLTAEEATPDAIRDAADTVADRITRPR
jgi:hypothetical protein